MSLITTANTFNLLLPCIRFKEDVDNWILFPYFLQQNKKKNLACFEFDTETLPY